ncbi:Hypothetical protein D9617_7g029600 [Elsinoe fawcettii]|nr:Hypothetical protein D9617_7g029600 [Elsinoe fawcettii]
MSNYHGQGVPYGIPRFPPPPSGRASSPEEYGGPRQNMNRQGPPQQQQRPPQNNQGMLRKNAPNNFSRGPMRPPQGQQQWPLPSSSNGAPMSAQNTSPRGMPPQRPPRPTGTAVLGQPKPASNRNAYDDQPIPQYANAGPTASSVYSGPGVWSDNGYDSPSNYPSPNSSRPITGASMASTSSSYSVPDAPPPLPSALPPLPANHQQIRQQQQQQQLQQQQAYPPKSPRERAPLGPPPSSRRGPSSYYSQPTHLSQVTPIVEESDSARDSSLRGSSLRPGDDSRGSYASSNAIPIGVPDYYLNDAGTPRFGRPNADSYASEYDEPEIMPPPRVAMPGDRDSPPALVRQASLGKRSKPTLTTIKSGENLKPGPGRESTYSDDSFDDGMQSLPPMQLQRPPLEPVDSSNTLDKSQMSDRSKGDLSARTGSSGPLGMADSSFFDRSSSESEKSEFAKYRNKEYLYEPMPDRIPRQPQSNPEDPRVESILNRLEKGGALPHVDDKTSHLNQPSQLSQRVGTRRPPRLNVDAVREAEQRGSLTSLPDLIRRATRLASNLDRGKTASRLGFDWMVSEEKGGRNNKRRSGSLSDMISAFPPPAVGTPRSAGSGRFAWPTNLRHSTLPSFSDNGKGQGQSRPKKRVCGMPMWAFLLLLLLLILLVAAAVIVPVVLIVVPKQNQSDAQSLDSCRQRLTCSNGGVNVLGSDNTCRCLCVNGFTGSSCTTEEGPSCSSVSVPGASNATVGSSLPRLFNSAQTNFSIPLDGAQVLSLFAATNLSCSSENALITFGGQTQRRSTDLDTEYLDTVADIAEIYLSGDEDLKPTKTLQQRQVTTTVASSQAAATSNGIVFAIGGPPGSSPSNSPNNTSPMELDFARVAVLFVLQDSGQLNEAIAAQSSFQKWFSGQSAPGVASTNITLQNGYSANLNTGQVVVKNGTKVGSP